MLKRCCDGSPHYRSPQRWQDTVFVVTLCGYSENEDAALLHSN